MRIVLYMNKTEEKHLYKDITEMGTIEATLKDGCDIVNPVLKIKALPAYKFNYIYIEKFDRFYFMMGGATYTNGIWEISFHCDVLSSNRVEILGLTCVVERQEFKYNLDLDDGTLKAYSNPHTIIKKFPHSITDYSTDGGTNIIILGGSAPGV